MRQYRYKAIDSDGNYKTGKITAEKQSDVVATLAESDLELISCSVDSDFKLSFNSGINEKDLISIFVHLEQLEKSGVSILDSVNDLKETTESSAIKDLMQEVSESIKNGNLFSQTLARYPSKFKPIYIGLISMGEKTGNLVDAFANIINDIKWSLEIKRKTFKALIGPTFGIIVMFIVLGVMTSFVIPKVTGFLAVQNIEFPATTTSLINFSAFFRNYWYIIIFGVPFLWISSSIISRSSKNLGIIIDNFKLKIPLFGPIIKKIESAKFCQFFSMTFKSGLGVIECLSLSSDLIKNRAIKNSISQIQQDVSDGLSLAHSISRANYFPNLVVRMFRVGEESGNMGDSLENIKFFYDREINDSIERITSLIQPILTMILGGMIAWIAIAVFGPVYSSFSQIR
ncbi:MAG: hypothetical protein CMP18_01975 [Rickettsiales bacterium]|nr:hypothetical protein [Rickettsiales bacterium]